MEKCLRSIDIGCGPGKYSFVPHTLCMKSTTYLYSGSDDGIDMLIYGF